MISKKLKILTAIALVLVYAHGAEEIATGFWKTPSIFTSLFSQFSSIQQAGYYSLHITFWLLLIPMFLLILGGRSALVAMGIFGLIFFNEIHHMFGAFLITQGYYPGVITSVLYLIVGFFYWKELIRLFKEAR